MLKFVCLDSRIPNRLDAPIAIKAPCEDTARCQMVVMAYSAALADPMRSAAYRFKDVNQRDYVAVCTVNNDGIPRLALLDYFVGTVTHYCTKSLQVRSIDVLTNPIAPTIKEYADIDFAKILENV